MISRGTLKALGPGLLFAAVSVGVSHLVQATRAGAGFGLSLLGVIVLAMVLKYPLFEFGQRYAVATGTSLLEGYRRLGRWTLVLYVILTLGTMFTVLAAVAAMTAGLAVHLTGLDWSMTVWSAVIIAAGGALLVVGRYPLLDRIIKVIMALLAVSAVAATVMVLPKLGGKDLWGPVEWTSLLFVVGLVGWMPTGMDVSVWQSFWCLARRRQTGHTPTLRETLFDFKFGYVGTGVLAVLFCVLGAAVVYDEGQPLGPMAPWAFADLIIRLFTSGLGEWSRPVIVVAAFTTMFSTTLTVLDGFPRALQLAVRRFRSPEGEAEAAESAARSPGYWIWMAVMAVGGMLIVAFYLKSLGQLIDLATFLSFLTAPFLGVLTYRAVTAPWVPEEFRPGRKLRVVAILAFGFLIALFGLFLYSKFLA